MLLGGLLRFALRSVSRLGSFDGFLEIHGHLFQAAVSDVTVVLVVSSAIVNGKGPE